MLCRRVGVATGPISRNNNLLPNYFPGTDRAAFNRTLLGTLGGRPQGVQTHYRQNPSPGGPGQQAPAAPPPVTFGPHEAEEGVYVYVMDRDGPWPFQYYRRTDFGYDTNEEWHAQLAATPWLDPKAFGNRPGAPANADHALQPGQYIIVLDSTRLDYLEQQRALLGSINRTVGNQVERETRD